MRREFKKILLNGCDVQHNYYEQGFWIACICDSPLNVPVFKFLYKCDPTYNLIKLTVKKIGKCNYLIGGCKCGRIYYTNVKDNPKRKRRVCPS